MHIRLGHLAHKVTNALAFVIRIIATRGGVRLFELSLVSFC